MCVLSCSAMSNALQCHELQHTRLPCPSPTLGAYSNSRPSSQCCHPTISCSLIPFSFRLQSSPASGSFQMSQLFASGVQNIGVSALASILPMNIWDWFPLGLTGWISLQSKGLSPESLERFKIQNINSSMISILYSPTSSVCKESACSAGDLGLIHGLGRSPGYQLQYSCLENSMDREAWLATVHRVAKSWTWLSD